MKTVRFPLAFSVESRTASPDKDARITNGYVETEGSKKWVYRRPGTASMSVSPSIPSFISQGMYPFQGALYSVVNGTLYKVTQAGVSSVIGTVGGGIHYFSQTSQAPYLFLHNTHQAWTYNLTTGVFAEVTNSGFPTNQGMTLVPGAVYLDDYTFVMTTNGRIYVSDIEDPTKWDELGTNPTGAYISKTSEPDNGVAVVKHLNYIISFGQWSSEFFYNSGATSGSPLLRNDTAKCEIGCVNGDSVVQFSQVVAFLGQARETGKGVFIFQGVTPTKVSTPAVDRYLNASNGASVHASVVTIAGHTFYLLTLVDISVTLVYDISEKLWYLWSSNTSGLDPRFYVDPTYFTPTLAIGDANNYIATTTSTITPFEFVNHSALNGTSYFQHKLTGAIVTLDTGIYQDITQDMELNIRTQIVDGNTNHYKFWFMLEIIGDRDVATVDVSWSDDDYTTWETPRSVSLNQARPVLWQLGASRRRAFEFSSVSNSKIRIQDIETSIREGNV